MTERQAVAHANPIARADEIDMDIFREIRRVPWGLLATVLTVNR